MDHIRPIERTRPRPEVAPVPRLRRPRRDEDRDAPQDEGRREGDGERRGPEDDGRLDVLA